MCGFDMRLLRFANTPSWSPPKLGGRKITARDDNKRKGIDDGC